MVEQSRDEQGENKDTGELTDYRERGMNGMRRTQKGQEGHRAGAGRVSSGVWLLACYGVLLYAYRGIISLRLCLPLHFHHPNT
jgi:hypothetical protein